jgi:ATP-binding protein involved in chromosome partitioning
VPLLAQLPLVTALREGGDTGMPITVADPDSESAQMFRALAERIAVELKPKRVFNPALKII